MLDISQNHRYYKADEIADRLGVKKFVIRTWEKQFNLNRTGMQYSEEDLTIFEAIRDLLYQEKLSPTEAKQKLPEILAQKAAQIQAAENSKIQEQENSDQGDIVGATFSPEEASVEQVQPAFKQNEEFWNNLKSFKEQLLKIQEQLK